eukprot:CAMPEP_0202968246 /NCGR_PEP_ID=MMETSP1396-20130829/13497_1 /ASSEMBLY_ACC=CAM_ASM_000872 /TAXON_ID= /ORGANISM="Pseudokeronopsis sp., Strain Brazil" /LENGTH=42 /DNA_ID= /DNA_START= /DNA_END= /DNA_ORIENTATION=
MSFVQLFEVGFEVYQEVEKSREEKKKGEEEREKEEIELEKML